MTEEKRTRISEIDFKKNDNLTSENEKIKENQNDNKEIDLEEKDIEIKKETNASDEKKSVKGKKIKSREERRIELMIEAKYRKKEKEKELELEKHKKELEEHKKTEINKHKKELEEHKKKAEIEIKKKHNSAVFFNILLLLIIALIFIFGKLIFDDYKKNISLEEKNNKVQVEKEKKELFNKIFSSESKKEYLYNNNLLTAKSAGIFLIKKNKDNIDEKETLYLKNEKEKVSLASVTKLMTIAVAMEKMNGKDIIINKKSISEEGNSGLVEGEKFKIKDLASLTLIVSSNDGARAISESFENISSSRDDFISEMNNKASELNMDETIFFSESGLDAATRVGGAYSNVLDIEKLVYYFYNKYPEISKNSATYRKNIFSDKIKHSLKNTDKLLKDDDSFILSKTGYTDLTGGNLVTVYEIDENSKIITVVLKSTKNDRFVDTRIMINTVKEYLEKVKGITKKEEERKKEEKEKKITDKITDFFDYIKKYYF